MNLTRYELSITRTFDETWDAYLRIPYFIKDQTATVVFPNGGSPAEREAAIRSGDSHHRTATYEGFADLEAGVGWRHHGGFLGNDSVIRLSLGTTIPTGATEEDPLVAGDLGLDHLHIQFGNGTFDPILDCYIGIPLTKNFAFSLYAKARLPFYENEHGYRGSPEATLLPRLTWLPTKKLSLSAGIAANYFGYSEWSGRRDPNSGQVALNTSLSAGYKWSEHLTTSANVLLPLYTESFSGEDSLDPAPTFSLSIGLTF